MNYWVTLYRFACALVVLLCAVGLACVFFPKLQALRELHHKKERTEAQNRRVEARIAELRRNQERFHSDPSFVERTARESGMVKPNETVFKFATEASGEGAAR
jgi:cell division protein FtsB